MAYAMAIYLLKYSYKVLTLTFWYVINARLVCGKLKL